MHEKGKTRLLVLGAGNFGTCLAQHLASQGHRVSIWTISQEVCDSINQSRKNPDYLSHIKLHPNIKAIRNLDVQAFEAVSTLVFAIPTQSLREVLEKVKTITGWEKLDFVCAAKGIEIDTLTLPSDCFKAVLGGDILMRSTFLSGPSFAAEVAEQQPTAVTLAAFNKECAKRVQAIFHSPYFRVYTSSDPIGVEVAGALKNVIAIAAGACAGLGLKQNSLAALITRGLAELSRIGVALGANPLTFNGLGGVGDLFLSCSSKKSRNYTVGYELAKGKPLKVILQELGSVAEGVFTTKAAFRLGKQLSVRTPIISSVHKVLYEEPDISKVVQELIASSAKEELE